MQVCFDALALWFHVLDESRKLTGGVGAFSRSSNLGDDAHPAKKLTVMGCMTIAVPILTTACLAGGGIYMCCNAKSWATGLFTR